MQNKTWEDVYLRIYMTFKAPGPGGVIPCQRGDPPPLAKILVQIDCGPVDWVGSAARRRLRGVGEGSPEVQECHRAPQTRLLSGGLSVLTGNHSSH